MIHGFRDRWLREFFLLDLRSRKIPPHLEVRLFRKLQLLDDATSEADLRIPPSNHFEKLRGNLDGCLPCESTINGGSSFNGIVTGARRPRSISTITVIDEVWLC